MNARRGDELRADAWPRCPGYLDTATYGLPPSATVAACRRMLEEWANGSGEWRRWNDATDEARHLFASFAGVAPDAVAAGSAASSLLGAVAASLPAGAEVVVPEGDFTSLLFPFLVQAERGVTVRVVPLEALADSLTPVTTAVAWSAVQSADGQIADTAAVLDAAEHVGAMTIVDVTQACGWLPLPLESFDAAVCSAYKWLCCPRGTAFMVTSPRLLAATVPHASGWFAAEDVHGGYYGTPLRLATTARRLDLSPSWPAWVGATASLRALGAIGMTAIHAHNIRLADALRGELDLEPVGSAIVAVAGSEVEAALAARGIRAATRASGCRLSFHLYNDESDVAAAADALRPFVAHRVR
jgi:selenocysteine lyase/cysteine desulfurase